MITPTVGRMCLYVPKIGEEWNAIDGQPFAAMVCGVQPGGLVNLRVYDALGDEHRKLDVAFAEESTPGCALWMEYQKGQAAKAEALEQQLGESQPETVNPNEIAAGSSDSGEPRDDTAVPPASAAAETAAATDEAGTEEAGAAESSEAPAPAETAAADPAAGEAAPAAG